MIGVGWRNISKL